MCYEEIVPVGAVCAFTLAALSTTVSASLLILEAFNRPPCHVIIVSGTTHDHASSESADYHASR
jgi:hypothetical protein